MAQADARSIHILVQVTGAPKCTRSVFGDLVVGSHPRD